MSGPARNNSGDLGNWQGGQGGWREWGMVKCPAIRGRCDLRSGRVPSIHSRPTARGRGGPRWGRSFGTGPSTGSGNICAGGLRGNSDQGREHAARVAVPCRGAEAGRGAVRGVELLSEPRGLVPAGGKRGGPGRFDQRRGVRRGGGGADCQCCQMARSIAHWQQREKGAAAGSPLPVSATVSSLTH